MIPKSLTNLFTGSFFRLKIPVHWEQEIIEDVACFFRGDCDGVLQIAASRSDTGEYNLMGELASYFKRNNIEYKTNNIVEYKTKQDILVLATEYTHEDRFWLTQFFCKEDRLLIVIYNGDSAPEAIIAREVSDMISSIEYI